MGEIFSVCVMRDYIEHVIEKLQELQEKGGREQCLWENLAYEPRHSVDN